MNADILLAYRPVLLLLLVPNRQPLMGFQYIAYRAPASMIPLLTKPILYDVQQMIGQHRNKHMRVNSLFNLMKVGPQPKTGLHALEGILYLPQHVVGFPYLPVTQIHSIRAEHIASFSTSVVSQKYIDIVGLFFFLSFTTLQRIGVNPKNDC
jgi:hypothetical protein